MDVLYGIWMVIRFILRIIGKILQPFLSLILVAGTTIGAIAAVPFVVLGVFFIGGGFLILLFEGPAAFDWLYLVIGGGLVAVPVCLLMWGSSAIMWIKETLDAI